MCRFISLYCFLLEVRENYVSLSNTSIYMRSLLQTAKQVAPFVSCKQHDTAQQRLQFVLSAHWVSSGISYLVRVPLYNHLGDCVSELCVCKITFTRVTTATTLLHALLPSGWKCVSKTWSSNESVSVRQSQVLNMIQSHCFFFASLYFRFWMSCHTTKTIYFAKRCDIKKPNDLGRQMGTCTRGWVPEHFASMIYCNATADAEHSFCGDLHSHFP
jgi:hypothetical protein